MARRRYQEGSVYLHRGRFYGRWRVDIVSADGIVHRIQRHRFLGVKSESDCPSAKIARRRLDPILARINVMEYRPGRQSTVEALADVWEQLILPQLKPSTVRSMKYNLKCHIRPLLGSRRLDEISAECQQRFIGDLAARGLSSKSIRNVVGTLSSMMSRARKWGYITGAVNLRELVFPETIRRPMRAFTAEEVRQVLARLREPFQTMLAVVAVTGLRAGEMLGLSLDDVDLPRRLLWVRQSAWRGRLQTVKTKASQAPLPLPQQLARRLEWFLATYAARHANPLRLLFCNSRGRPYNHNQILRDELRPALKATGLHSGRCGFHAFRHAHSSLLVALGATPAVAAAQLRHSDPRLTLAIYTHALPEDQRAAVDRLAAAILCQDVPCAAPSSEHLQ